MAEVARRAGVSVSTVSHVINGTRFVSPAKLDRVTAAVAQMGYQPNSLARSLKLASTNTVGLAISAISNPYFTDIICAVEAECARLGLMVFLSDTQEDSDRELSVVRAFHQRRVDGVILAPSGSPDRAIDYLAMHGIPCVLIDRLADDRFDQIGSNNREAMRDLIDHVAGFGHRRIGFVAGQTGLTTTIERIDGLQASARRPWAAVRARTGHGCERHDRGGHRIHPCATRPAAAAHGDRGRQQPRHDRRSKRAVRERSLTIPDDLSLVGFDDFEWADCFSPRLTLMAQPCEEIGRQAAALLSQRIALPDASPRVMRLRAELKQRESCGRVR